MINCLCGWCCFDKSAERCQQKKLLENRKFHEHFVFFFAILQTGQCVKVYHGHHQGVNCIEVCKAINLIFNCFVPFFAGSINVSPRK